MGPWFFDMHGQDFQLLHEQRNTLIRYQHQAGLKYQMWACKAHADVSPMTLTYQALHLWDNLGSVRSLFFIWKITYLHGSYDTA